MLIKAAQKGSYSGTSKGRKSYSGRLLYCVVTDSRIQNFCFGIDTKLCSKFDHPLVHQLFQRQFSLVHWLLYVVHQLFRTRDPIRNQLFRQSVSTHYSFETRDFVRFSAQAVLLFQSSLELVQQLRNVKVYRLICFRLKLSD